MSHKALKTVEMKTTKKHNTISSVGPNVTSTGSSPTDILVQTKTKFGSLFHLLCYLAIICNGNLDTMIDTLSELTCIEEWVLGLEWMKTNLTQNMLSQHYSLHRRLIPSVYHRKLRLIFIARKSFLCMYQWRKIKL